MAETVDRVVSGGTGDQGFRRHLHPTGEGRESVEHHRRVDSSEVSEEDSVEA
jgi:hypothetical protein